MNYRDHQLCPSPWHDSGHSYHSTCPSCGGKGMRQYEERVAREEKARFERRAKKWARENGWTPPVGTG